MHIPDGFLNTRTWVFFDLLSAAFLILSLERIRNKIGKMKIPLLGVVASFIFAAQLLNFPILGPTSGHLIGGALAAILLGPWVGIVVMTTVLVIQCLIFQDGGLTSLGANIFNMGILSSLVGFPVFVLIRKIIRNQAGLFIGSFVAGWLSVILASLACGFELGLSQVVPVNLALTTLGVAHVVVGLGEGFITAIVVKLVFEARPDLINFAEGRE